MIVACLANLRINFHNPSRSSSPMHGRNMDDGSHVPLHSVPELEPIWRPVHLQSLYVHWDDYPGRRCRKCRKCIQVTL